MTTDESPTLPRRTQSRAQLPDEVATYVRELIISGKAKPGEFLRLEPISQALGISNTPVREGLLLLKSEGFVHMVPRRGFVVASFTQQDIRDLFWAQASLAGELAARAARNMTPDRLASLQRLIDRHEQAVAAEDQAEIAELGHQFHREINLASDSNRLALLLGAVVKHLPNRFYAEIEGQVLATQTDHPEILQALEGRDSGRARELMSSHILKGSESLIDKLKQRGVWDNIEAAG